MVIMEQFRIVSGLELNKGKTQLMVVGNNEVQTGSEISGITVVDRVKILGITIDRALLNLNYNWDCAILKISRLINFWKIQRLSISGRILVAKTYLLSQVTFLLGSLDLNKEYGDRLNELFANYIKGADRIIARDRWCIARELGGYGMINVHTLNTCIKAAWINKWIMHGEACDINGWRVNAEMGKVVDQWGEGRFSNLDSQTKHIMVEWRNYKRLFYRVGGNVWRAPVFENDGILEGQKNIGVTVFGERRFALLSNVGKRVTLGEISTNGRIKDKAQVEVAIREEMNMAEYFRLRNIISMIYQVYGYSGEPGRCLDMFIRAKKRGGVS